MKLNSFVQKKNKGKQKVLYFLNPRLWADEEKSINTNLCF